jgi:hypothetical protein
MDVQQWKSHRHRVDSRTEGKDHDQSAGFDRGAEQPSDQRTATPGSGGAVHPSRR